MAVASKAARFYFLALRWYTPATIAFISMPELGQNRRARFDYEILEKLEAGLLLTGAEVKSAKAGHISIAEAFVTFHGGQAFLTNAHISAYEPAAAKEYEPLRSRGLLLHKKQLEFLREKALTEGLTVVPLKVYTKNRLIKVEIAVAKGRKQYDKRAVIKQRDVEREIRRHVAR